MGAATSLAKVPARPWRASVSASIDTFFFVFAGAAAIWLAVIVFQATFRWGWSGAWFLFVFWLLLAYLVLPRLHRILTRLYVPDYFIGRTRTSDGLLGDPVNLAANGRAVDLHAAMERAGWIRADPTTLASGWRIVRTTLVRRSQDVAYQQEVAGNPAKRHHVRFWRCPDGWLLPGGHRVDWLAAGTFDRSVGFSWFTLQVTHKIDADTDIERDHIVATLLAGVPGARMRVIRDFSTGYHARNGGGDSIRTDDDLPVVDLPVTDRTRDAAESALGPAPSSGRPGRSGRYPFDSAQRCCALGPLRACCWAGFVLVGSNVARVLAMTLAAVSIMVAFVTGDGIVTTSVLQAALSALSFDILILLALSSDAARHYAHSARARTGLGDGE